MSNPDIQKRADDLEAITSEQQVLKAKWHDGRTFTLIKIPDGYWLSIPDLDGEHIVRIILSSELKIENVQRSAKMDPKKMDAVAGFNIPLPMDLVGKDLEIFDAFIEQAAQQQLAATKPSNA